MVSSLVIFLGESWMSVVVAFFLSRCGFLVLGIGMMLLFLVIIYVSVSWVGVMLRVLVSLVMWLVSCRFVFSVVFWKCGLVWC